MLTVQLPIPFLKALLYKHHSIHVLWLSWLALYPEKVKDPFFVEWLFKTEKLDTDSMEKFKQVYDLGKPYLDAISFGKIKKTTQKSKIKETSIDEQARRVLTYLNLKTGLGYGKIKIEPALKPIKAILNAGYSPFDCKDVIDKKYIDWYGTDFEKYLRPSTLFNLEKFDTYLNQPIKHGKTGGQSGGHIQQVADDVEQAIAFNEQMGTNKAGTADNEGN